MTNKGDKSVKYESFTHIIAKYFDINIRYYSRVSREKNINVQ